MAKKEKIEELFDNIAPEYDYLNHLLSLEIDKTWRRKAVNEIVDTDAPQRILDVACGTADLTIATARKSLMKLADNSAPHTHITGIDLSEKMLEIGRKKVTEAGFANEEDSVTINLIKGDCEELPFADSTFDRISSAFGVRNFEHLEKGLKEMHRTLKQNGKLIILELSIPTNPIIRWFYKLYFLKILPLIGGRISGNRKAYKYLPASVQNFPQYDTFCKMLHNAGFRTVRHQAFTFGICRMFVAVK